jgi:hypothetical protein
MKRDLVGGFEVTTIISGKFKIKLSRISIVSFKIPKEHS